MVLWGFWKLQRWVSQQHTTVASSQAASSRHTYHILLYWTLPEAARTYITKGYETKYTFSLCRLLRKEVSIPSLKTCQNWQKQKEEFFKGRMLLESLETYNPLVTLFTWHPMIQLFIFPDTPLYLKHRKFVLLVGKLKSNTYRSFTNLACFCWSIL